LSLLTICLQSSVEWLCIREMYQILSPLRLPIPPLRHIRVYRHFNDLRNYLKYHKVSLGVKSYCFLLTVFSHLYSLHVVVKNYVTLSRIFFCPSSVYYYDAETLNNPASPKIGLFCRGSYPESPVPLLFIERTVLKVRQ